MSPPIIGNIIMVKLIREIKKYHVFDITNAAHASIGFEFSFEVRSWYVKGQDKRMEYELSILPRCDIERILVQLNKHHKSR